MNVLLKSALVVSLIVVVGIAAFWFSEQNDKPQMSVEPVDSSLKLSPPAQPSTQNLPLNPTEPVTPSEAVKPDNSESGQTDGASGNDSEASLTPVDVTALGRSTISEDDLQALILRLENDPNLLTQLIDEMRQETDPARLALLSQILGEVGGDSVTLLASEFIFSGDTESRTLGLDLLQMIQPGNPQARDIVASMLATEVEPQVLVNTLTTLAVPGDVDDHSRSYLADQVAWLANHSDSSVRSISLDILSRWSTDDQYTPVLLSGLDDESEHVRTTAAYALAGHEDQSPEVIERLMGVIGNPAEPEAVRRASILAVKRMPITDEQRQWIQSIERELNTVVR